jgi:hypothetical protein
LLSVGILEDLADALAPTDPTDDEPSDCFDYITLAARPYAAIYCGDAFDHIVQYAQSAALHTVVLDASGVMTTPYSCLQKPTPCARQTAKLI